LYLVPTIIEAVALFVAGGSVLFSALHAVKAMRERALARRLQELGDLVRDVSITSILDAHGITEDLSDVPEDAFRYLLRTLYLREAYHLTARSLLKQPRFDAFEPGSQMWELCRSPLLNRLWEPVLQRIVGANRSGKKRGLNSLSDRIDATMEKIEELEPSDGRQISPRG
jgi:hypothetical protein